MKGIIGSKNWQGQRTKTANCSTGYIPVEGTKKEGRVDITINYFMQKHNSMTLSTMVQGDGSHDKRAIDFLRPSLNLSKQIKGIGFERTLTYFGNS